MGIRKNDQNGSVTVWPEKLHRQGEKVNTENGKRILAEESSQFLKREGTDIQIRNQARV